MDCKFDVSKCSIECKKYPICSYYSIQNQFIETQSQLNFIYTTIGKILQSNETNEIKVSLLEEAIRNKLDGSFPETENLILLNEKEQTQDEKENK
jgi:hypothetical protein